MSLFKSAAEAMERAQAKHDARREWLRNLNTGDAVTLTCDGARRLKTVERATVTRRQDGALWVDGHPRRDVSSGKWERGGKDWLWLRIDPVGAEEVQR